MFPLKVTNNSIQKQFFYLKSVLISLIFILIIYLVYYSLETEEIFLEYSIAIASSVLIILANRNTGWIFQIPYIGRTLELLGERSYSFYLVHPLIIHLLKNLYLLDHYGTAIPSQIDQFPLMISTFLNTYFISHFSYEFLEKRILEKFTHI